MRKFPCHVVGSGTSMRSFTMMAFDCKKIFVGFLMVLSLFLFSFTRRVSYGPPFSECACSMALLDNGFLVLNNLWMTQDYGVSFKTDLQTLMLLKPHVEFLESSTRARSSCNAPSLLLFPDRQIKRMLTELP